MLRTNCWQRLVNLRIDGNSISFWLKVKPRSQREGLRLDSSGQLRLEVSAPAAEGQANEACVRFLARALGLPQASVVILAGKKSRRKLIRIVGDSAQGIVGQLDALTADD